MIIGAFYGRGRVAITVVPEGGYQKACFMDFWCRSFGGGGSIRAMTDKRDSLSSSTRLSFVRMAARPVKTSTASGFSLMASQYALVASIYCPSAAQDCAR